MRIQTPVKKVFFYNASSWVVFPFQEAQPNQEMKTLYIYISHTKNQDELFN